VSKLSKSEVLMLNIGSMCTGAKVLAVRSFSAKMHMQTFERGFLVCQNSKKIKKIKRLPLSGF